METANNRLDNAVKSIETNHELIQQLAININSTVATATAQQDWLLTVALDQLKFHLIIQNEYQQLYTGYTNLLQGKLSPIVISHTELLKTIRHIHSLLFIHRPGYHLLHNAPTYFYHNAEFKLHKSNRSIFILVKFPLGPHDQPMKLFKILHYPVPVTNSSSHATTITALPSYLAISHLRDSYTTLPESALNGCSYDKTSVICHFSVPLRSIEKPNCALALYKGNKSDIHNLCNFRLVQDSVSPYIRQLNESHFLMVNISIVTLSCPLRTHILNGCSYCIIQVPCNCSIFTEEFSLPKRHTKCHSFNNTMSVMHPVNLILLHKFFGLKAISNITADMTFPTPLNVSVKPFLYFNHEFSKLVANDQRAHLNLDRAVARAKENKVIFQDLAEPFLNSEFSGSSDATFNIVSIIAISISTLGITVVIIMYQKYRKLLAVVMLLHRAGQSSASPTLPSFIYTDIPNTTTPPTTQDIHVHIHNYSSYVILIFALFAILLVLYRCIRKPRPALMVDITNGKECTTCFIMHLPLCIQNCHFHATLPFKVLEVQGIFYPALIFDWGDFGVYIENSDSSLTLPSTVRVSPWQAYQIRKAIRRVYPLMTQLWACHHKFGMPIKFCDTSCTLNATKDGAQN